MQNEPKIVFSEFARSIILLTSFEEKIFSTTHEFYESYYSWVGTGVSSYQKVNSELSEMHLLVPLYKFGLIFFSENEISDCWS